MATYYLSPTGNDLNAGTSASPWYSLQRGYNGLSAGDTLLLMDGTYHIHETIACYMTTGGSLAGGYKTIRAVNKGMAILDGDNIGQYCFEVANASSYIKIKDLMFTRWRWYPLFCNSHQDNKWIWFQGNTVYDSGNILNVGAPDYLAGGGVFVGYGCSYWIITQNKFYRVGARGYTGFRLNKDHAFYSQATSPYSNSIEFSYNLCWQISGNAMDFSSSKSLIVNNTFAWTTENDQGASIGIIDSGSAENNIIANNQFFELTNDSGAGSILERSISVSRWYVFGNMNYGINGSMWYQGLRHDSWLVAPNGTTWDNWGQIDCKYGMVNPQFVHAVKGDFVNVDFHLQPTSPAINKGYPVKLLSLLGEQWVAQNPNWLITDMIASPGVTVRDLDGIAVSGNPDIGCYELNSGIVTYYSAYTSQYFQKNNCGEGYVGSRVLYQVPAGTYTSTVSQADADAKAAADISANGQAYANANGFCTLTTKSGSTGNKTIYEYYEIGATGVTWKTNGEVITKN